MREVETFEDAVLWSLAQEAGVRFGLWIGEAYSREEYVIAPNHKKVVKFYPMSPTVVISVQIFARPEKGTEAALWLTLDGLERAPLRYPSQRRNLGKLLYDYYTDMGPIPRGSRSRPEERHK